MTQTQCPNCQSYKTAQNRLIVFITAALFIFPMPLILGIFLGVFGALFSFAMAGVMFLAGILNWGVKGNMCMNCHHKWK